MADPIRDLRLSLDRPAFAAAVGFPALDPWQAELLGSDERDILLNVYRQAGKSTCAAIIGLHAAIYDAPGLALVLAPSLKQSEEVVRTVRQCHGALADAPRIIMDSITRIELENGSRVAALPGTGDSIRGYSFVKVLIVDEAARVNDELISAALPMQDRVPDPVRIVMSTPKGRRGWFHEQCERGVGWRKVTLTAEQVGRLAPEYLEKRRRELGELMYRQEYLCEFIDDGEQAFNSALIDAAFSAEIPCLDHVLA